MKLNDSKILDTVAGFMVASLLGLILFIIWAALTGNLIMPEPEYQRRKIELAMKFWLIIGGTGIIGGLIGFLRNRARNRN